MANKNNNYYGGKRRKNSSGKIWGGLIAFTLTAAIVASVLGVGTGGFKDWSFSKWFGGKTEQNQEQTSGGAVITDTVATGGISLMSNALSPELFAENGVSAAAETAYTITATAQPAAALPEIDWSIGFQNAASTWANGKSVSDYVTYTVSEDTTQATVSCSKAFGEPIIITATSAYNTEAKATCKVDYVRAVTSVENYMGNLDNENGEPHSLIMDGDSESNIGVTINFGVGTLEGEISMSSSYAYLNASTMGKLNNRYLEHFLKQNPNLDFSWADDIVFDYQAKYLTNETDTSKTYTFEMMPANSYVDASLSYSGTSREQVNAVEYLEYAVKYATLDSETSEAKGYFEYNIVYTYNNTTISITDGTTELLPIYAYSYTIPTTANVTINNGNIIFLPN